LPRDPLERDVVNVDLVPFDQKKKEIERTFENVEFNLVIDFHGGGGDSMGPERNVNRAEESLSIRAASLRYSAADFR
jgi:hypothetical protein